MVLRQIVIAHSSVAQLGGDTITCYTLHVWLTQISEPENGMHCVYTFDKFHL